VNIPRRVEVLLRRIGALADRQGVSAYAVGGCVRDWCLGSRHTPDLDVTVEGDGVSLAREAGRALGAKVQMHPPFGTATLTLRAARSTAARIDVATCRTETYAKPAAYPRVSPGALHDDLFRRDFTMNAMAVALNPGRFGALVDPFGGRRDLAARRLRVLHPRSFLDDPSRMLRGIRFARRFGCRFAPATAAALRRALRQGALGWLNAGRLRKELERVLDEPDPRACLRDLAGWLGAS